MLAPGSFGWLVRHEMRLAWRGRPRAGAAGIIAAVLFGLWVLGGIALAFALMHVPIRPGLLAYAVITVASVAAGSLMTTQAMIGSQQTLYGSGDLDLLLTAPVPPRAVMLAKLIGIAANIALTYAVLILPFAIPLAALGHPRLFGVVALLLALALLAAALGFALTLALARAVGPRAARTVGQIAAALMGGAFFIVTQLGNAGHRGSAYLEAYRWMRAHGLATDGPTSWPGRAAFGEAGPLVALLFLGAGAFALVGWAMQRQFLAGYQDAGMRLTRARPSARASGRLFHATLFRSIFAKEWRLLARDPALIFQILMRLIYMAPLLFLAFRRGGGAVPIAPTLAFASVLITGQLAGSFAWLAVAAEDSPELLVAAPVSKAEVERAKLLAALALAAPFALLLPLAMLPGHPLGALITLVMTVLGGAGAGLIEVRLAAPASRATFAKRRQGSVVAGLLAFFVTGMCGAAAAVATYFIG